MYTEQELAKYENKDMVKNYVEKMGELSKKLHAKFADHRQFIENLLNPIERSNIIGESNKNIDFYHKINTRLAEERIKLHEYKDKSTEIESQIYDYFKNHSDISSQLKSETAITHYVEGHPCHRAINNIVVIQQTLVQYLETALNSVRDRGYAIKNIIEAIKIELGITS
jgi:hypothetical protein